jgi:hypothetical protein
MGKRELLLVIGFLVAGLVVYRVTAPPSGPGEGFSVSRLIQNMRRGVQGNRAAAELDRTRNEAIESEVQELRFFLRGMDLLSITGEDRRDAEILFHVTSRAFDDAEAKKTAEETTLVVTRAGSALRFVINYPPGGQQRSRLSLKVPKRLRIRLEPMSSGKFDLSNVAGLEAMGINGDTTVKNINGPVTMNHRGGESLTLDGIASLKLNTRGGNARVHGVSGFLTAQTQGGEFTLGDVVGPAEIESRNTDVRIDNVKMLKPPLRLDLVGGSIKIEGLRTEARIDGRDTETNIAFDAPAAVTIYNTSEDITITPPPGGYTIDAVATDGHILFADGTLKPTESDTEQRLNGPVRGGGPAITIRATRGDVNVKNRVVEKPGN